MAGLRYLESITAEFGEEVLTDEILQDYQAVLWERQGMDWDSFEEKSLVKVIPWAIRISDDNARMKREMEAKQAQASGGQ